MDQYLTRDQAEADASMKSLTAKSNVHERGLALLDVLLGMAIFALIAVIAVQAMGQFRERAHLQATTSDAKQLASGLEVGWEATTGYRATIPPAVEGVNLSGGVSVGWYSLYPDGKSYILCTEHDKGGYTIYDSDKGAVTDTGRGDACPANPLAVEEVEAEPVATSVVGWGNNSDGQTSPPAGLDDAVAIASGRYHSLALKSDGTVVVWGATWNNQAAVPSGLSGVVAITAGSSHSLALKSDGTVVGWGYNGSGQASPPAGLTGVVAIAAGDSFSLALKSDGTVVGWGSNDAGQRTIPAGLTGVVAIDVGDRHALALKSDGTVVGWGFNGSGQRTIPAGLTGVVAIATGNTHSVALRSDGTVVGWGSVTTASPPGGLTGVVSIAAGGRHTLALKSDGTVVGWGSNDEGQTTIPTGLTDVISVDVGGSQSLALKR